MIYVGIDDTDTKNTPGTNQLARSLIRSLHPDYENVVAVRHQLLVDPRVPYTSKNSSASMLFKAPGNGTPDELAARLRQMMTDRFVPGSDPGLCLTEHVPEAVVRFGQRSKKEITSQSEARQLAADHNIHLEGLGGTENGVIGALAAVGLVAYGNDGRVVNIGHWPDNLSGAQDVASLRDRGVAEIRCLESGTLIESGTVDVGKHLRPNYRNGRIVLFVTRVAGDVVGAAVWRAVRFS